MALYGRISREHFLEWETSELVDYLKYVQQQEETSGNILISQLVEEVLEQRNN